MSTISKSLVRYNPIAGFSADKFAEFIIKSCAENDTQKRTTEAAHEALRYAANAFHKTYKIDPNINSNGGISYTFLTRL